MPQTVTINNELLRINPQKNSIEVSVNGGWGAVPIEPMRMKYR